MPEPPDRLGNQENIFVDSIESKELDNLLDEEEKGLQEDEK